MSATSAGYLAGVRRTPAPRDEAPELFVDLTDNGPQLSAVRTSRYLRVHTASLLTDQAMAAKDAADQARTGALGSLVALIPSEALAIYIAGLAWIAGVADIEPGDRRLALTIVMIAAAVFSAILIARSFYLGAKAVDPDATAKVLGSWTFVALVLVTEAAFFIYVLALPDSPFGWPPLWTGLAAILITPLLVLFAGWLTKKPNEE